MALRNAGYDKEILNGGELDKKARKLLQAKTTRKRTLFRFWPRDPNGKPITKDNSCFGKHTNSGVQIWGATLSDLYRTYRIPSIKELVTVSSGSKLAEWMKKNGELDWAPDEIALAELEDEPVQVPPCDIADLVQPTEHKIALKFWGTPMPQTQEKKKKRKRKNKNAQRAKVSRTFEIFIFVLKYQVSSLCSTPHRTLHLGQWFPLAILPQRLKHISPSAVSQRN